MRGEAGRRSRSSRLKRMLLAASGRVSLVRGRKSCGRAWRGNDVGLPARPSVSVRGVGVAKIGMPALPRAAHSIRPLPTPPRCRNTHIRCTCCSGGASTTIAAASLPRACFHPVGSGVQAVVQAVGSATRAGSELSSAVTDEAGSHPWTSPYSRLRYVSIYVYSSNQRLAVLCVEAALVSSVEECASITCGETTLLPYGQNISLRASKIVALPSRSFSFTLPTCYATKW